MLKPLITILLLLKLTVSFSQNEIDTLLQKTRTFNYFFNGGFGIYIPTQKTKGLAENGSIYSFQIQVNIKRNIFSRLAFDLYNIGYTQELNTNGLNLKISDKVQTLNIGFDFGFNYNSCKKFNPYTYLGLGYALMEVPVVRNTNTLNSLEITNTQKPFLSIRVGLGADYKFNKIFILSAEIQYLSIPFKTDINNRGLNGIGFQIGFKTPLQ